MVDPLRLRSLLERLRATEDELLRLRGLGIADVRADPDRRNSVKYLFVLAAEIAIDAGQHVIASRGLPAPHTFADVFTGLAREKLIDVDLAMSLGDLARFRNLLVHGYAEVDDDRVLEILHSEAPSDLSAFREQLSSRAFEDPTEA